MEFPLQRTLSDKWIEYRIGANTLALAARGGLFNDPPPPTARCRSRWRSASPPDMVAKCAAALEERGVKLTHPLTDHAFGHRTIFFRDPDGNVIEIYAEI